MGGQGGGVGGPFVVSAGPGLAVVIPNDLYDGSLGSMACIDLIVAGAPELLSSVEVTTAINHDIVTDLLIKLRNPSGKIHTLLNRPCVDASLPDDGTKLFVNCVADLQAAYPVTFRSGSLVSAEAMGNNLADMEVVCLTDKICDYEPAAGTGQADDLTSGSPNGTWQFCVGDTIDIGKGHIDAVTLALKSN